jgi:methyltransferase
MTLGQWIVTVLALLRVVELFHAERNTRRLIAAGGHTLGDRHYPAIVGLHAAWLIALWWAARDVHHPDWALLGLFVALEIGRLWVIATLGPFWTTRIVTLPGAPLIRHGPYRWLKHPNYLIVSLEIPVLPFALGAPRLAVLFGAANVLLLAHRIRVEEDALRGRQASV